MSRLALLRARRMADEAGRQIGPEGSLCLLVVDEPLVCVAMFPLDATADGDRLIRQLVDTEGRGLCPELPPPAHRVKWAEEQLPAIVRRVAASYPEAGISLIVWFGDRVGEHRSVWLASTMAMQDNVIFFRDYLGNRPS